MKKVSIVMPIYNSFEYLEESIKSIIKQTYQNWELIIINEYGYDDNSIKLIESFNDLRIKIIQNTKKEGISKSLNVGLANATGEYIARMDADDISGHKRLEEQIKFLDENIDIGLCGIVPEFFGEEKISWDIETDPIKIKHNMFFYSPCVHPTIMFRKDIMKKYNVKYNENFTATEDYDFLIRFLGVSNIANINDKSLFKYRMHHSNATNKHRIDGIKLYNEVMNFAFKNYLNLNFSDEEISLLNSHISVKGITGKELYNKIINLDILLKKILYASFTTKTFDYDQMFLTLNKRWSELSWTIDEKELSYNDSIIRFILKKSIFSDFTLEKNPVLKKEKIELTVLLPVYKAENYILDSIRSILNQTYKNFEILVIAEKDKFDNSLEYLKMFKDKRIKIVINEKKLGLSNSLNKGIKLAKTKYLARMDADDISLPDRFEKEIEILKNDQSIVLIGSWQRHFGSFGIYIHKMFMSPDDLKASLLFSCDICHSTVMMRRDILIKNNLFYNPDMAMEDFELWNRIVEKYPIVCIPEILGEYRIHNDNISASKFEKLIECEIEIISNNLEKLNIKKDTYDKRLLIGWKNIYIDEPNLIQKEIELLGKILKQNLSKKIYNQISLQKVVNKRIDWIYGKDNCFQKEKISIKSKAKKVVKNLIKPFIKPIYDNLFYRIDKLIQKKIYDEKLIIEDKIKKINDDMNDKTELYKSFENKIAEQLDNNEKVNVIIKKFQNKSQEINDNVEKLECEIKKINDNAEKLECEIKKINDNAEKLEYNNSKLIEKTIILKNRLNFVNNKVKYHFQEKIRVVFLFQVPSFWPSWEYVYNLIKEDNRFDCKLCLLETNKEPSQMNTAKSFLDNNNIEYINYSEELIKEFRPHIIFMQTPYDDWHRNAENDSKYFISKGIRLIYIPYGVEISHTYESIRLQYGLDFFSYMWKIYTISDEIKYTYYKYNDLISDVVVSGHPKFDAIYYKKSLTNYKFKQIHPNKKILLLKLHFKRDMQVEKDRFEIVTPDLKLYLDLINKIKNYKNIYTIVLTHPKFYDYLTKKEKNDFKKALSDSEKFYEFRDDDYREALYSVDMVVSDRSALLLEAIALDIPVMYTYNSNFREPFTLSLEPLLESLYNGSTIEDIILFIDNCLNDKDEKKGIRELTFKKCIPYFDGKCSSRIVKDIVDTIYKEND